MGRKWSHTFVYKFEKWLKILLRVDIQKWCACNKSIQIKAYSCLVFIYLHPFEEG